jgi:hypothetical protein
MAPRYGRVVRGVSLTPGGFEGDHGNANGGRFTSTPFRTGRDRARGRARRSAR